MLALTIATGVLKLLDSLITLGYTYRQRRLGAWGEIFYWLKIVDTDDLQKRHWEINCWQDEEVSAWKTAFLSSCNAVAVAGAIFASVGVSSLTLPNIDKTHWTCRAFLASSMALGILSSISATSLHRKVAGLNDTISIRLWLSRGEYVSRKDREEPYFDDLSQPLPLVSSISALQASKTPTALLNLAFMLFIVGFSLYLLFSWIGQVENPSKEQRNIFIFFVCVVGAALLQSGILAYMKVSSEQTVRNDFKLLPLSAFRKSEKLEILEQKLRQIQSARNIQNNKVMEGIGSDERTSNPLLRSITRFPPANQDSSTQRT